MPDLTFPSFPNAEAIAALKARGINPLPSGNWYTVWQQAHETAFTVAQSTGYDILNDIFGALMKARQEGMAYREFRTQLEPVLQKKGWWGRDQATGKMLGSPWRLKTIFQQNMRVSAARGEWQAIQEVKEMRPYLRYSALLDKRTRPLHASWDGVILPVDHPWWKTHFPPNGWNCRCKAISVDEEDLDEYGWKLAKEPPDDGERQWLNPATGQTITVPNGIDPGWAYNPGEVNQTQEAAKIAIGKLASMPPEIAREGLDVLLPRVPENERTKLGRAALASIVQKGLASWLTHPDKPFPLGILTIEDAASIGADTQIAKMSPETLQKQKEHHPELDPKDYALAQEAIAKGAKYRQDERNIAYVLERPNGLVVIVKGTAIGDEIYVTSLWKLDSAAGKNRHTIEKLKRGRRK